MGRKARAQGMRFWLLNNACCTELRPGAARGTLDSL